MRSTRWKVTMVVVLALLAVSLTAVPAAAKWGRAGGRACGMGRGMGPAFTQEQQEQIEKIHEKYADERAELTNRLNVIMLESSDFEDDEAPDFARIERNIEEAAEIRVQLAKLRLKIHKEIRPLLDEDQRVLFDRGLAMRMHGRMGGQGMMGRGAGRGMGRGMRCMPGGPGAMPGGMGPGMRCMPAPGGMQGPGGMSGPGGMPGPGMGRRVDAGEAMPWCPFADAGDTAQ